MQKLINRDKNLILTPGFQYNSANKTSRAAVMVIPAFAAVMDNTATNILSSFWN